MDTPQEPTLASILSDIGDSAGRLFRTLLQLIAGGSVAAGAEVIWDLSPEQLAFVALLNTFLVAWAQLEIEERYGKALFRKVEKA